MDSFVLASAGRDAETLFSGGGPLTVAASFARSFYVRSTDGLLACIGGPGLGDGPLNALCVRAPAIPPGGTILSTGMFDRSRMTSWRPAPPGRLRREGLRARLAAVAAARPRGLAAAIPAILGAPFESQDPFVAASVAPLLAVRDWVDGPPPDALARLVGLGPGLTPAGDDALGGAVIALRAAGRTSLADALSDWIERIPPDATSEIARTHLRAAARGEGSAALHAALGALMRGEEPDLAAIDAIGHSSGWDALAGAVAVLAKA